MTDEKAAPAATISHVHLQGRVFRALTLSSIALGEALEGHRNANIYEGSWIGDEIGAVDFADLTALFNELNALVEETAQIMPQPLGQHPAAHEGFDWSEGLVRPEPAANPEKVALDKIAAKAGRAVFTTVEDIDLEIARLQLLRAEKIAKSGITIKLNNGVALDIDADQIASLADILNAARTGAAKGV